MSALHSSDLSHVYAKIALDYDEVTLPKINSSELQQFVQVLPQGARILDLGSGPGRDALWFATQKYRVTLYDLSSELLAIAQRRVPNANVVQGDMTEMTFEQDSFEGVWANASLLHLTKNEMDTVLSTIYSILTPDGVFFCSLKRGNGEGELEEDKYRQKVSRFFSFYQEDELREKIATVGFTDIKSTVVSSTDTEWIHVFARKPYAK